MEPSVVAIIFKWMFTLCITAFVELAEFSEFIDSASKSGKIRINLFLFRDE